MLPSVAAFLLCEHVQRDARGLLALVGLFDGFNLAGFPAVVRDSWLYCALTDGHGEAKLTFRLTDASDLDAAPLLAPELTVTFRDPLAITEVALSLAALRFPAPGVYVWHVECNGELIHTRRLLIRAM